MKIPTALALVAIRDAYPRMSDPLDSPVTFLRCVTGCNDDEAEAALLDVAALNLADYKAGQRRGHLTYMGSNAIDDAFLQYLKTLVES